MKRIFLPYGYAAASVVASTLLVSFILAALFYFQVIATPIYEGLAWICGILVLTVAGLLFGRHMHSRILIQILVVTLVLLVMTLFWGARNGLDVLRIISKNIAFFIGAMIGQAIKK